MAISYKLTMKMCYKLRSKSGAHYSIALQKEWQPVMTKSFISEKVNIQQQHKSEPRTHRSPMRYPLTNRSNEIDECIQAIQQFQKRNINKQKPTMRTKVF